VDNVCKKPEQPGCSSDLQCADNEFCGIPPGQEAGNCEPVQPGACGEVRNHAFVPYGYECGTEPGCPACPGSARCINHECVQADVSCPATGIVGDEQTCAATENGQPCAECDFEVTDPSGKKSPGRTDESGNFNLPLNAEGTYRVALLKDGQVIKTIEVKAFPQGTPTEPGKPGGAGGTDALSLLWLILLLLLIIGVIFYWRRRNQKK
jgi:LPXTG-motif cell wall-anchored protein